MIEDTLMSCYENISDKERENILNVDFSVFSKKTKLTLSNDTLENILVSENTNDDGGIIAMTGFYYQMLVSILYLDEVFKCEWDGMFLDHHQDIVLFNESKKIVKFVQVKTKKYNFSNYEYEISRSWIPKLFKTAYDIEALKDYDVQFEIVSNCYFSDEKNTRSHYSLIPFYSNQKNIPENQVEVKSIENFKKSVFEAVKRNSNENELADSKFEEGLEDSLNIEASDYFKKFKMKHIPYEELEEQIVSRIPRTLGFDRSQLSLETVNDIIGVFFKSCYNPKDAKIQLIKNEKLKYLQECIKKQLTSGVDSAYHKVSDYKILSTYFTKLKYDFTNSRLDQDFINEFLDFTQRFKDDIDDVLSSSNLTMLAIMNMYLKNDRGIDLNLAEDRRPIVFEHLLSLLLFLKVSINKELKIDDDSYHVLSIHLDNLLFLILGNDDDCKESSSIIKDFKDLFPRLDNAEKLRIANLGDISMIVAGEFDEDGSEEYTEVGKDELEFSLKPSIDNAELQGIDNNNITEVQTPINILYVHQSNLSNIKKARKHYSSLKDMKNKIDMELKLNESTR